jgi:hypothetical protein
MKKLVLYLICPILLACDAPSEIPDEKPNLDDDFEYPLGGYSIGSIYVYKAGELIPAHNYVFETAAEAHSCTLSFVTYGICQMKDLSSGGRVAFKLPAYPPQESTLYDIPGGGFKRYLQEIEFTLQENMSESSVDYKFQIITDGMNGFISDIIIRQAGK